MNFYISNNIYDEKILNLIRNDNRAKLYRHPVRLNAIFTATDCKGGYLFIEGNDILCSLFRFIFKCNIFYSIPLVFICFLEEATIIQIYILMKQNIL